MLDTCKLLACTGGLTLVLAALTWARWNLPLHEITFLQWHGRKLIVVLKVHRALGWRTEVLVGSVTTWRDSRGQQVRDRARVEWLYALWQRERNRQT